jgi:tRNA(Ile2) C34 agmatinyltransferase TiaS
MKDELHLNRALKELQDYREIGSVECFRTLKGLNTSKKVNVRVNAVYDTKSYHCPNCESNLTGMGFDYCVECGQKINWGD